MQNIASAIAPAVVVVVVVVATDAADDTNTKVPSKTLVTCEKCNLNYGILFHELTFTLMCLQFVIMAEKGNIAFCLTRKCELSTT